MEEQQPDEQEVKTEAVAEIEKTEISQPESKVNTIMTIGADVPRPGQNTTVSTVSLQTSTAPSSMPSPKTKVLVKYPDKWKKDKLLKDGETYSVAPETAAAFVQMGIATVVKEDKS